MVPLSQTLLSLAGLRFSSWWLWAAVLPPMMMCGIGFMLALPILSTIISNATNPDIQGLTQGVAQSTSSLLRGLGPFISGAVFSHFYEGLNAPAISFAILGGSYLVVWGITCTLPEKVEGSTKGGGGAGKGRKAGGGGDAGRRRGEENPKRRGMGRSALTLAEVGVPKSCPFCGSKKLETTHPGEPRDAWQFSIKPRPGVS